MIVRAPERRTRVAPGAALDSSGSVWPATLGRALQGVRTRIVVCEGEYTGSVDVTRAVEVYGGVSCDFTKAGAKAKVVATKPAYGIKVEKVTGAVVLADLDVVGMNAAAPSESSVGVFVTESGNVKLLRSRVEAGDGADAPAARDGSYSYPADALLKGANADDKGTGSFSDDTPGAGGASGTCPGGGTTAGGIGGVPGGQGNDAQRRDPPPRVAQRAMASRTVARVARARTAPPARPEWTGPGRPRWPPSRRRA